MTISITDKEASGKLQDGEVVLSVKGVSKKFCRDLKRSLLYGVQDIATELVGTREKSDRLRPKEFWALNDVSFELRRGEALGLVGANGSGKTTLLRIISGLIKPDTGSVEVKGRVAPLIALGAGFNPILTGRENIYANMSILGLSKKEIDERFQDVVDFAEIGDAIDTPVQSYSSGMAARLGFACAIHTEPDILLIDEVMAVGDAKFKAKCLRKLQELVQKGISFVLVNHSSTAILDACSSAAYLSKGKLVMTGDSQLVVHRYEEDLFLQRVEISLGKMCLPEKSESESLGLDISELFFRDSQGNITESLITGEPIHFCVKCKAKRNFKSIYFYFIVKDQSGGIGRVLYLTNSYDGTELEVLPGEREIQLSMPYLGLRPGLYTANVSLREGRHLWLDEVESFTFKVKTNHNIATSLFYQPRTWKIT